MFPIFLIRGPEGQICSSLRKNRKYTKLGKSSASLLTTNKTIRGNQSPDSQAYQASPPRGGAL